ncbi:lipoate-protein ligase A [Mycoplasma testudineum]|uniref:lipoate--protein ligase n=1 Tax=Mycoplasma testudineum TaxID=244584 RepID=A0A4R6IAN3_9MOLU|nr:lipoate--protein ligase [Mycoplasma testudineum]OYD26484.1 lipoyltransferase [Mycoplasma testudineum]TDO18952.1 lipoate-protein ligase A [Mycoplasma testudineum]
MSNIKWYLSKKTSPYENLVLEEAILRDENITDDIFYFYRNDNSIIIGRNQNIYEEVNLYFAREKNINLYRRISGGGAVYQDLNNVCFSYITHSKGSYEKFLTPIIEFLKSLGLNATFKGRNDLAVDGFKVSGNAQYSTPTRMVHHGTLLFDFNIEIMQNALKVNPLKMESKGIKSIRQRVASLINLMPEKITIEEFVQKLVSWFAKENNATELVLDLDLYETRLAPIRKERMSDEWIFGKTPNFEVTNESKFDGGIIRASYSVKAGKFCQFKFEGDYLSKVDTEIISEKMIGINYEVEAVQEALTKYDLIDYFGEISLNEIIEVIFGKY